MRGDAPACKFGADLRRSEAGGLPAHGRRAGSHSVGGVQCCPKHIKGERRGPLVAAEWLERIVERGYLAHPSMLVRHEK